MLPLMNINSAIKFSKSLFSHVSVIGKQKTLALFCLIKLVAIRKPELPEWSVFTENVCIQTKIPKLICI